MAHVRSGHVATRQNVQFHFMKLHDVELALRLLTEAGLTTREACGNSVRNITACPYAGVAAGEVFDVTPYAEALTRCSTAVAPWFVVPADRKWYSRWAVYRLLLERLDELNPQWPPGAFDVEAEKRRLLAS